MLPAYAPVRPTERVWAVGGDDDTGAEVYRVLRVWDRYRSEMLTVLEDVDLILTRVAPHAAVPPGAEVSWRYTTPYSLTGWPCAVVRAGWSAHLPIGVQVVAGPWQDHVALAGAAAIERALGGWQPPAERPAENRGGGGAARGVTFGGR